MANQNHMKETAMVPENEIQELKQSLPKAKLMGGTMLKYQGFWCPDIRVQNVITFQRHFQARDTDLFIASLPKTGSTWLKSLLFAIINRDHQDLVFNKHPHELVYSLEADVYGKAFEFPQPHHLDELASPRILSTHVPYTSLPESIKTSECRILYITRNPLDTLVSYFHFITKFLKNYSKLGATFDGFPSFEDTFKAFCNDVYLFGPFFDHVVGYWKESLENPNKILFLKYEDLKDDPIAEVKKVAEFVGMPFTSQEESDGVLEKIINMCSIKNMKELDVNKSGFINKFFDKKSYFRKGEVGDWTNHFTPSMVEEMKKIMDEKLRGTGLSLKLLPS